jgi:hypothetical protein
LNEVDEEDSQQKRAAGAALVAGLLLHFAILFLWGDSPNDIVGVLTGIFPDIPYDRYFKYPLAVLFFFLFCWRTVTLYRKQVISLSTQFWYVVLALLLGWIWFFIALSRLQFDVVR